MEDLCFVEGGRLHRPKGKDSELQGPEAEIFVQEFEQLDPKTKYMLLQRAQEDSG